MGLSLSSALNSQALSSKKEQAARLFVDDAQKMIASAQSCLAELSQGDPTGERTKKLFRVIHTLKGTAVMVPGFQGMAGELQELEGRLSIQHETLAALSRPVWFEMAEKSLRQARARLEAVRRELGGFKAESRPRSATSAGGSVATPVAQASLVAPDPVHQEVRGILARAGDRKLFFPLSSVIRVFSGVEISGRKMVFLQGTWVPLLGECENPRFGIGVRMQTGGLGVVGVTEVVGVYSNAEASTLSRTSSSANSPQTQAA